jgi:hypothetical protein
MLVAALTYPALEPLSADDDGKALEALSGRTAEALARLDECTVVLRHPAGGAVGVLVGTPPRILVPWLGETLPEGLQGQLADGTLVAPRLLDGDPDLGISVLALPDEVARNRRGLDLAEGPTPQRGEIGLLGGAEPSLALVRDASPWGRFRAPVRADAPVLLSPRGALLGIRPGSVASRLCLNCHMSKPNGYGLVGIVSEWEGSWPTRTGEGPEWWHAWTQLDPAQREEFTRRLHRHGFLTPDQVEEARRQVDVDVAREALAALGAPADAQALRRLALTRALAPFAAGQADPSCAWARTDVRSSRETVDAPGSGSGRSRATPTNTPTSAPSGAFSRTCGSTGGSATPTSAWCRAPRRKTGPAWPSTPCSRSPRRPGPGSRPGPSSWGSTGPR